METVEQIPSAMSQEAIQSAEKLYNAIQTAFPEAVTDFESKWMAAHAVCPSQITSASVDACVRADEFEALRRLDPKIIPLVVFKLANKAEQNSFGVLLYNAVNDPDQGIDLNQALVSQDVLRSYTSRIIELSYERNKLVEERVRAWKDYSQDNHLQSSSIVFTDCQECQDLLEMGPSIIAHLMVEYYHDQWGYWYQLLHEIIHGRKMRAHAVWKRPLFEAWCRSFNREHAQAFKYIPTPTDRAIYGIPDDADL